MEKYVMVTGGAGGIGKALSEVYAKNGHNVVIVDINIQSIAKVKKELEEKYGIKVFPIEANLLQDEASQLIYDECNKENIFVEILVNNAGIGSSGDYATSDWSRQRSIVELNNLAMMHLIRLFLPEMIKNGNGKICNIASNAGFMPLAPQPIYGASKAFVISFSQALYEQYKKDGISVTCICPGPTKTAFFKNAGFDLKNLKGATPESVAEFAYKKTMAGKALASHGFSTKMMSVGSRLFPRVLVRSVAAKVGASK